MGKRNRWQTAHTGAANPLITWPILATATIAVTFLCFKTGDNEDDELGPTEHFHLRTTVEGIQLRCHTGQTILLWPFAGKLAARIATACGMRPSTAPLPNTAGDDTFRLQPTPDELHIHFFDGPFTLQLPWAAAEDLKEVLEALCQAQPLIVANQLLAQEKVQHSPT